MLAIVLLLSFATLSAPVAALAQLAQVSDPGALPLDLPPNAPTWVAVMAMFLSQVTQSWLTHLRERTRARGAELKLDAIHAAVLKVDAIHQALIEEGSDGSRVPRLRTQHDDFLRALALSSERHAAAVEGMARLLESMSERVSTVADRVGHVEEAIITHHEVAARLARDLEARGPSPAARSGASLDDSASKLFRRRRGDGRDRPDRS